MCIYEYVYKINCILKNELDLTDCLYICCFALVRQQKQQRQHRIKIVQATTTVFLIVVKKLEGEKQEPKQTKQRTIPHHCLANSMVPVIIKKKY